MRLDETSTRLHQTEERIKQQELKQRVLQSLIMNLLTHNRCTPSDIPRPDAIDVSQLLAEVPPSDEQMLRVCTDLTAVFFGNDAKS